MKEMNFKPFSRGSEIIQQQSRLAKSIARWTEAMPLLDTPIKSLTLIRSEQLIEKSSYIQEPSVCFIAQGAKEVMLGNQKFCYDRNHFLIASVDLPVTARLTKASRSEPYLGLVLRLDQQDIAQLLIDQDFPKLARLQDNCGMAVSSVSEQLLNSFERLIELLNEPESIPILAPLLQREITYRLLISEQGALLRQIALAGSRSNQISRAIAWLKSNYSKVLRIEDLASLSGMSTSTFHHHFRSLTAMSPLQYQKWLRLHEARRLMLTERQDAATASFQVGYESPSQFSREYSRLFGAPPLRDVKNLLKDKETSLQST